MRKYLWISLSVFLILVLAGVFRWGETELSANKSIMKDRWLQQEWSKVYTNNSVIETPIIPNRIVDKYIEEHKPEKTNVEPKEDYKQYKDSYEEYLSVSRKVIKEKYPENSTLEWVKVESCSPSSKVRASIKSELSTQTWNEAITYCSEESKSVFDKRREELNRMAKYDKKIEELTEQKMNEETEKAWEKRNLATNIWRILLFVTGVMTAGVAYFTYRKREKKEA